ncbi:hypothetical protein [Asticcacaulis sp. EMRT-3]|nr:hypothetical protein [Asticcacaulis sp. EMRT-3]MDI7775668.1 hypothetical protein [Asticcacaulis sp. EMRT-3]
MAKDIPTRPAENVEPEKSAPDLTNTCAVTFYAAIWLVVAALVSHMFWRY